MTAEFTIGYEPTGKERPRFARTRTGVRTYTPPKTAAYESTVQAAYMAQCRGTYFANMPIAVEIKAFYKRPKRTKNEWPIVKPDSDNIAKAVCDALNGVAYDDDKQIVWLTVKKQYAEEASVEVKISAVSVHEKQI